MSVDGAVDMPRGRKPVAFGTGLLALDIVMNADGLAPSQVRAGGTCGNVLAVLSYLGWDVAPIARLKNDRAAARIRKDLSRWSVRLDLISVNEGGSTPVYIHRIGRSSDGEPVHTFTKRCPRCGGMLPGYKPLTATSAAELLPSIQGPQVFFFDRASRGSLTLARHCAGQGALVMFEPSGLREAHLFREAVQVSHVLKYSRERLGGAEDALAECDPLLQVETLGKDGLRYRSRLPGARSDGWKKVDAMAAERVRDTSGAGDWCSAGILHHLGRGGADGLLAATGDQLGEAIRFGQALSAWNCGFEGARGGMYERTRLELIEEVTVIVAQGRAAGRSRGNADIGARAAEYDFCSLCHAN
jgi:sugar/nucleoside kinase (ribokinase family)